MVTIFNNAILYALKFLREEILNVLATKNEVIEVLTNPIALIILQYIPSHHAIQLKNYTKFYVNYILPKPENM